MSNDVPFGARIIRTVRAYIELADDPWESGDSSPQDLIEQLRWEATAEHHPAVLHALEQVARTVPHASEDEEPVVTDTNKT